MTINLTMAVLLAALYTVGFYLIMQRSLMRVVIGIVILGHGVNLFLQVAGGPPGESAFVGTSDPAKMVDPLPQAMALTAIVITFALTTFLLALAYRAWVLIGHDEVQDDPEDQRVRDADDAARAAEEVASAEEVYTDIDEPDEPDEPDPAEPAEADPEGRR